jgi:glycerophosphoryl diester phosphodiesterase
VFSNSLTSRLFALAIGLCLSILGRNVSAVEIIAHRGASADAPENTLASMKLAWEQKADAIETDLWLSKDGHLVVFHDADTRRYDGKQKKVTEMSWEELQKVDVGSFKDPRFKNERIPTLEALLATIPEGKKAVLELKDGPHIVPEFTRAINASGRKPQELNVISFNYESLKASKKAFPKIPHYFLMGYKKNGANSELSKLISQCKEANFDGLNLQSDWPITKEFVAQVKSAGLKMLVWTVDDPAIARRMVDAGVDAITTNKPQWLREQLK